MTNKFPKPYSIYLSKTQLVKLCTEVTMEILNNDNIDEDRQRELIRTTNGYKGTKNMTMSELRENYRELYENRRKMWLGEK